ncbi:2OG-Fe(II) oxygenase [Kitasatospora sp. NPDC101235]|uniref:2OG-Fe(II) oxygenase n=1 Tax=Kitasatospora sp. NPDC101235 TaxID=3364101 RepID=UPI00382DABFE
MAPFAWHGFDVRGMLPEKWQEELLAISDAYAQEKMLVPTSLTSREAEGTPPIKSVTVPGNVLGEQAPWLLSTYHGLFRDLGQRISHEQLSTARDDLYGAVLNIQYGTDMRYECHVDSNPLQGLLYVTDHPRGDGGELVVGHDPAAHSVPEVDADCSVIHPAAGHLLFFDARQHPHYVRALTRPDARRVVVAMNFYTPTSPETQRPTDLNDHLFAT